MTRSAPRHYTFRADCPARLAVDIVGHRWALVLMHGLRDGPRRPSYLRLDVGGISSKVLTQTLRRLEHTGLVERRRYAEAPPRVDYALTDLGRSLLEAFEPLAVWSQEHADAVVEAQERTPNA